MKYSWLNSGEHIPPRLSRDEVGEQSNIEVLDRIGFPVGSAARGSNYVIIRRPVIWI